MNRRHNSNVKTAAAAAAISAAESAAASVAASHVQVTVSQGGVGNADSGRREVAGKSDIIDAESYYDDDDDDSDAFDYKLDARLRQSAARRAVLRGGGSDIDRLVAARRDLVNGVPVGVQSEPQKGLES